MAGYFAAGIVRPRDVRTLRARAPEAPPLSRRRRPRTGARLPGVACRFERDEVEYLRRQPILCQRAGGVLRRVPALVPLRRRGVGLRRRDAGLPAAAAASGHGADPRGAARRDRAARHRRFPDDHCEQGGADRGGRRPAGPVVEFGGRRAHGTEAAMYAARAAYVAGCAATSNVEAGLRFRDPALGHDGALVGDDLRRRDGGVQGVLRAVRGEVGLPDRHLRHARGCAEDRRIGSAALGRPARQREHRRTEPQGAADSRRRRPQGDRHLRQRRPGRVQDRVVSFAGRAVGRFRGWDRAQHVARRAGAGRHLQARRGGAASARWSPR